MTRILPKRARFLVSTGLLIMVSIGLLLAIGVRIVVDADYLQTRLNLALATSDEKPLYTARIGSARLSLISRSIEVQNSILMPIEAGDSLSTSAENRLSISVHRIRLDGIKIWPLIWNQQIKGGDLHIDGLQVDLHRNVPEEKPANLPTDAGETGQTLHQHIGNQLTGLAIRRIVLNEANFFLFNHKEELVDKVSIEGIDIRMSNVDVDTTRAGEGHHVLFSEDVSFTTRSVNFASRDSTYHFVLGPTSGSSRDSLLEISTGYITPQVSDEAFSRSLQYRTSKYHHRLHGLALRGISFRKFLDDGAFLARSLSVDSVYLDIFKDKRVPLDPDKKPPQLLHEAFQSLNRPIHLDTVRVLGGEIWYREVKEDGELPGVISFEDLALEAVGISNDSTANSENRPVIIKTETRLFGIGLFKAGFEIPLNAHSFDMKYAGWVGSMPARPVNNILTNLEGMHIEGGAIDSLKFEVTVVGGEANGLLTLAYHDLEMQFVDKIDRSRNLRDRLKTFVVDKLMVDSNNPSDRDKPIRTVNASYTLAEDNFFRFLWRPLRNGLVDSIKK